MSSRDPWLLEGRHYRLCMQPCVCGPRGSHGEAARAGSRDETRQQSARCSRLVLPLRGRSSQGSVTSSFGSRMGSGSWIGAWHVPNHRVAQCWSQ